MGKGFMMKAGWGFRLSVVCGLNVVVLTGGYAAVSVLSGAGGVSLPGLMGIASASILASLTVALTAHLTFVLPLKRITGAMDDLASNRRSMTHRLPGVRLGGSVGGLSRATDQFLISLSRQVQQIKGDADTINASSEVMHQLAIDVLSRCGNTVSCTNDASSAGAQVSANMHSVSTAVEEASSGIAVVASAAEEMSATITEIAGSTQEAQRVAEEAVERVQGVSTRMGELTQAAGHITHVTQTIADISEQTNLLALNATIEAARAGDAGKGFAVVANEIKALAAETSGATATIKEMLSTIQTSIGSSEKAIGEISEVIASVRDNANNISAAVQQQSMTSNEIAASATQAAGGISEITRNIAETSDAASALSTDIVGISNDASGISFSMLETKLNVEEMADLARNLDTTTSSLDTGTALFHIGKIKVAHMGWRTILESVLAGVRSMDASEVTSHTECDFGKWYFGEGKVFASEGAYQDMGIWHEKVHSVAREIVSMYNAGKKVEARRKMSDFIQAKERMFSLLDDLYLCEMRQAS
ncbi:hypothetical protein DSLASN_45790 [Desulfoluna limicola]|uniref:Methyl-accepting chemotaxis protein n=2 Tax=Desulfoluna limicola TaxID=2810562 RepID=A0ABN6FBP4_9BACT|nr:hypothetical protein DSLASN_45790 [Desulfoluna limicola]